MKLFTSTKNFLIVIFLIALFFRTLSLGDVPPSPSLDEVSIGYNAYSILETGADEYGYKFPLLLQAYDDWRPALYVYLVIPFIKIFGLTAFSVRFPSVILSLFTVVATYFLIKELFNNKIEKDSNKGQTQVECLALFSSFLLAISPWHIYISRLGHEANAGLAFLVFGVLFFVKRQLYLSFAFFALSFMSYQSEKIIIPVFLLGALFLYRKELLAKKKEVIMALAFFLIILTPFLKVTAEPNALARFKATNVFGSYSERFYKEAVILAQASEKGDFLGKILHNRRVVAGQIVMEGYLSHFRPLWLFANPSEDKHKVPGLGLLYPWEKLTVIIGFFFLLLRVNRKTKMFVLLWFFIAPLPAALTTETPHAMRSYTFLPIWQIFSALGIIFLWNILQKPALRKLFIVLLGIVIFVNLSYLYKQYFVVFPKTQSSSFQYALAKAIPFVLENETLYNKIVFSNQNNLYQSYMFFLFNSKYDPHLYQLQGGTKSGGYDKTHSFDKFEFRPIDWEKEEKNENILYAGNPDDFRGSQPFFTTYYLDGKEGVTIVSGKQ